MGHCLVSCTDEAGPSSLNLGRWEEWDERVCVRKPDDFYQIFKYAMAARIFGRR